jgi:deoxycitidine kinase
MPPIIISLDGNIGAGKSTLIAAIAARLKSVRVIPEPVGDWMTMKNQHGQSLLQSFYSDQTRWCYTFQNCALLTRLLDTQKLMNESPDGGIIITERSVLTDRYVFAEMLHSHGKMDDMEWNLYMKWYDHYAKDIPVRGVIYLTTSAEISKERIGIRGREGEESIPIEYLTDLDYQHHKWLSETTLPTLCISTESGTDIVRQIEEWITSTFIVGIVS